MPITPREDLFAKRLRDLLHARRDRRDPRSAKLSAGRFKRPADDSFVAVSTESPTTNVAPVAEHTQPTPQDESGMDAFSRRLRELLGEPVGHVREPVATGAGDDAPETPVVDELDSFLGQLH